MSETITLAVDAATYAGSVAVLRGAQVLHEVQVVMRGATEERLMPAIVDAMARAEVGVPELAGVACGAGPGSFTSLRIAAALAKGIAASRAIPFFVASSLTLVVAADPTLGVGDFLVQLDAMRGDVYVQRVRRGADGRIAELSRPELMSAGAASELAARESLLTVGNAGAMVERAPHARGFAHLIGSLATQVSLASWEPMYGRLAEAQVQWERRHGKALVSPGTP